jgi:predicted RNase H-like nuclease (RuvC/YqgF family)
MGQDRDGNLITTHIDCWNEYYKTEIDLEKNNNKLQQENIQLKSDIQDANKEIIMLKELNECFRKSIVNGYDTVKQMESDLQALRELLEEISDTNQFCTICGTWEGHKDGCVLKAELDKLKVDE